MFTHWRITGIGWCWTSCSTGLLSSWPLKNRQHANVRNLCNYYWPLICGFSFCLHLLSFFSNSTPSNSSCISPNLGYSGLDHMFKELFISHDRSGDHVFYQRCSSMPWNFWNCEVKPWIFWEVLSNQLRKE